MISTIDSTGHWPCHIIDNNHHIAGHKILQIQSCQVSITNSPLAFMSLITHDSHASISHQYHKTKASSPITSQTISQPITTSVAPTRSIARSITGQANHPPPVHKLFETVHQTSYATETLPESSPTSSPANPPATHQYHLHKHHCTP